MSLPLHDVSLPASALLTRATSSQVVILTAFLSSLSAGPYATGRTLRSMALVGEGPRFAARASRTVPYGSIRVTASLGLLGVLSTRCSGGQLTVMGHRPGITPAPER